MGVATALLAVAGCAARPPSKAIVVPPKVRVEFDGDDGEDMPPAACQMLCAAAGQADPPQRCYRADGWDYHQYKWIVCHYGAQQ